MKFDLSDSQITKAKHFIDNHKCKVLSMFGLELDYAIPRQYRHTYYRFDMLGIGAGTTVGCSCGKELDITEYEKW